VPIPRFLSELRSKIGTSLLVLPAVAGAVFDDAGRILLIRNADDRKWGVPGGIVEPDEHPARRVIEKLREETGLVVEPRELIAVCGGPTFRVRYPNGDQVSFVVSIYECAVISGTPVPDGEESLEVGWFARAKLDELDMSSIGRTIARFAYRELEPLDVDGLLTAAHGPMSR
jgi:ADP-ribose pyrophosphatase YjhB (NUDIX family)